MVDAMKRPARQQTYVHTNTTWAVVWSIFSEQVQPFFSNLLSESTRPSLGASPAPLVAAAGPERAVAVSESVRQKLRPAKGGVEQALAAPPSCPELDAHEEVEEEVLAAGARERGCR